MSELTIIIDTGNDAFVPDVGIELATILEQLANRLTMYGSGALDHIGDYGLPLRDVNGNTVGRVTVR